VRSYLTSPAEFCNLRT